MILILRPSDSNFTITIDKNINANYQCVYSSNSTVITSSATPATLVRSNTLTCRPPTVLQGNWNIARDNNRELNVDLVIKISSSSAILASKYRAIYLFGTAFSIKFFVFANASNPRLRNLRPGLLWLHLFAHSRRM